MKCIIPTQYVLLMYASNYQIPWLWRSIYKCFHYSSKYINKFKEFQRSYNVTLWLEEFWSNESFKSVSHQKHSVKSSQVSMELLVDTVGEIHECVFQKMYCLDFIAETKLNFEMQAEKLNMNFFYNKIETLLKPVLGFFVKISNTEDIIRIDFENPRNLPTHIGPVVFPSLYILDWGMAI